MVRLKIDNEKARESVSLALHMAGEMIKNTKMIFFNKSYDDNDIDGRTGTVFQSLH